MASAEETIERAHAAVVALYDAGDVAHREAANAHLATEHAEGARATDLPAH